MKECIEKMKKEYSAPQMEVLDFKIQGVLCGSDVTPPGGDVEYDG